MSESEVNTGVEKRGGTPGPALGEHETRWAKIKAWKNCHRWELKEKVNVNDASEKATICQAREKSGAFSV